MVVNKDIASFVNTRLLLVLQRVRNILRRWVVCRTTAWSEDTVVCEMWSGNRWQESPLMGRRCGGRRCQHTVVLKDEEAWEHRLCHSGMSVQPARLSRIKDPLLSKDWNVPLACKRLTAVRIITTAVWGTWSTDEFNLSPGRAHPFWTQVELIACGRCLRYYYITPRLCVLHVWKFIFVKFILVHLV